MRFEQTVWGAVQRAGNAFDDRQTHVGLTMLDFAQVADGDCGTSGKFCLSKAALVACSADASPKSGCEMHLTTSQLSCW